MALDAGFSQRMELLLAAGVRFAGSLLDISGVIRNRAQSRNWYPEELRERLMQYESRRVRFRWEPKPLSREKLIHTVMNASGPRLLIVNTVQSAAVLARDIAKMYGLEQVEHLSTALTP